MRLRDALITSLLLTGFPSHLEAQMSSEPEVRRALPVETPPGIPVEGIPIRKALPVDPSVTSASALPTPSPARATPERLTSMPAAVPTPKTVREQQSVPPVPPLTPYTTTDSPGSIRMAPAGSLSLSPEALAASQLALADGFYAGKHPESAIPEYEKFLIMATGTTAGRERALYRLAESQRMMGNAIAAEETFRRILREYPSGEYVPSAQFRLGEFLESQGNNADAAQAFAFTAKSAGDPSIREAALYQQAICLEKIGKKEEASPLFATIAKTPAKSPYKVPSMLHLASSETTLGHKEQAAEWYRQIVSLPAGQVTPEAMAEASIKEAVLLSELGKSGEARKLFDQVTAMKDAGPWGAVAALGAVRLASQAGDQSGVLKSSDKALAGNAENRPEILLLRANALHKLGNNTKSLEDYDTIIREYPGSNAASAAPFQRLIVLHSTRSPNLCDEIDHYLLTASDPGDRARAQLLKAEVTLGAGKYKEAAALYHAIPREALPESSRPDIVYKEAWAMTQSGDKQAAITSLDGFLGTYPSDGRAPATLAQRALLKQQLNDLPGALADFSLLLQQYPKAPERELALQQKALLLGQQQDNKGMSETFQELLRDYPKSNSAPQAHYWIGWTAMEGKDYPAAVEELSKARTADPKQFGERAGLRILVAEYYLGKPDEAAREAKALKPSLIPPEVARWLGLKAMESGDYSGAERFLSPLVKEGLPGASDSQIQATLASALVAQGKFSAAQAPASACLKLARDPSSRAQALLVAAAIQQSMKNIPSATSMTEEAMLLQPEGSINAQARILSGDLLLSKQDYASAAKAYMTVAVLYEDPVLTPKALARAADAYRRSGNLTEAQKTLEELRKRYPNAPVPTSSKS